MEDEIHKKVDAVMHSIDNINRASPQLYLFTRLEARMQNEKNIWGRLSSFVARPVVAFACICFILILNAMVIFFSDNDVSPLAQQVNELTTADEYSQVGSALYEFENTKP
jgi:hypothetical protein